eukprot:755054-Rhodomonas_salina.11
MPYELCPLTVPYERAGSAIPGFSTGYGMAPYNRPQYQIRNSTIPVPWVSTSVIVVSYPRIRHSSIRRSTGPVSTG